MEIEHNKTVLGFLGFEHQAAALQDAVDRLKETMEREHLPLAEMEREREAFQERLGELETIRDDLERKLEVEKTSREQVEVSLCGYLFQNLWG